MHEAIRGIAITAGAVASCDGMGVRKFMKKRMCVFILLLVLLLPCVRITAGYSEAAFSDDPDAVERAADSVFMLEVYSANRSRIAIGSGFIAFENNLIVTNNHVIEGATYIIANSDDDERYQVERIEAADEKLDIAFLRLGKNVSYTPLVFDPDTRLKRSMRVVAIGSPAGLMNTISIGNISAFYRDKSKDWIQFTAPISSGSSGGPLLNDQGKVIGVTTATYASAQNVNMAVKASDVVKLYEKWSKQPGSYTASTAISSGGNVANTAGSTDATVVYVTSSGKKYHLNPSCSRMKKPIEISLLEAIQQGYEPCGICYR